MNTYRMINLVGRYKYLKYASEDFYNYAKYNLKINDKDINLISTDLNSLDFTLKTFILQNPKNPNLIINSFYTPNKEKLKIVNDVTNTYSNYSYENINLDVSLLPHNENIKHDFLSKHTMFNDIYYIYDTDESKEEKLKNIFKVNINDGV